MGTGSDLPVEVSTATNARIGLVSGGLAAYWDQFPGLHESVTGSAQIVKQRLEAAGADVFEAGFVDNAEKATLAGDAIRTRGCDLLVFFVPTYLTSSLVLPVAQRAACPVLVLNLQPGQAMTSEDRVDTGRWLAFCGSCSVPEIANAFERSGIDFRSISGCLDDPLVWVRVEAWIKAGAAVRAVQIARIGLMGHLYPGMLDVSTDLALLSGRLGSHVEVLEFDDLRERVQDVSDAAVEDVVAMTRDTFVVDLSVDEKDLVWAARVSAGLDSLVSDFDLDAISYYHRGLSGEVHERLGAGMILGSSLLTARGIPAVGEFELRTTIAMLIMSRLGGGGSFTELQALDLARGHVEMGHDGPAHLALGEDKPRLRGLGLFHGKRGWGVTVEVNVAPGPVTAFGLTQLRNGRLRFVASEGVIEEGPLLAIGNTTSRVDFGIDPGRWLDEWSRTAVAHHWALGTGHRIGELSHVAELLDIEYVTVG